MAFFRVGTIYIISGVFAIIMTATFSGHHVSVGASGALFGLLGASVGELFPELGSVQSPSVRPGHSYSQCCWQFHLGNDANARQLCTFLRFLHGPAHFAEFANPKAGHSEGQACGCKKTSAAHPASCSSRSTFDLCPRSDSTLHRKWTEDLLRLRRDILHPISMGL